MMKQLPSWFDDYNNVAPLRRWLDFKGQLHLAGWQKMSVGTVHEHDNIRLYFDSENKKFAIVLKFSFESSNEIDSSESNMWHTERDVAKTLANN